MKINISISLISFLILLISFFCLVIFEFISFWNLFDSLYLFSFFSLILLYSSILFSKSFLASSTSFFFFKIVCLSVSIFSFISFIWFIFCLIFSNSECLFKSFNFKELCLYFILLTFTSKFIKFLFFSSNSFFFFINSSSASLFPTKKVLFNPL